jgi:hypothetical protein
MGLASQVIIVNNPIGWYLWFGMYLWANQLWLWRKGVGKKLRPLSSGEGVEWGRVVRKELRMF